MKYKIILENLEIDSLLPYHYEEIKAYQNEYFEVLNYDSSDRYPFLIQVGNYEISFKREELEVYYFES